MTDEQKTQYVVFMASFIKLLSDNKVQYEQAQKAALAAATCLLEVAFGLEPTDDNTTNMGDFVACVIHAGMNSFYGVQADPAMLN